MKSVILYTVQESTIAYDASIPCMILKHKGFLTDSEFQQWLNRGLEIFTDKKKENGKVGWLVDVSEADAASEESLKWVAENYNPRAFQRGIYNMAFVLPEDEYAMGAMNASTYKEELEIRSSDEIMIVSFNDEGSAKVWIKETLSNG